MGREAEREREREKGFRSQEQKLGWEKGEMEPEVDNCVQSEGVSKASSYLHPSNSAPKKPCSF